MLQVVLRNAQQAFDPPKKRTDTTKWGRYPTAGLTDGSPINPRKSYGRRPRHHSLGGSPNGSPRLVCLTHVGGLERGAESCLD